MSARDPIQRFVGGALMAVGGLIAALCGTCTLAFIGVQLADVIRHGFPLGSLMMSWALFLAVGGLPTLAGGLIFRAGWRRFRPPARVPKSRIAVFSDDEETP